MLEDLYKLDNLENTGTDVKVNNFPKTAEFLSQEGMQGCKSLVEQVLNDKNLIKEYNVNEKFEEFLNKPSGLIRCRKNLQNCKNFDDVAGVILSVTGCKVGKSEIDENSDLIKEIEQKKETVEQDKKIEEQKKETLKERGKSREELMQKCVDYRDELLENRPDVKQKTQEEAKKIKENLKIDETTKQKLNENGIDEGFIDNYILVNVTLNEVKNDSTFDKAKIKEFEGLVGDLNDKVKLNTLDIFFKNLDNACNIPDTNLNSFSSKNITRTRHELFNSDIGNQDLIEAKKSNLESRDYSEMINEEMSAEDLIQTYGKFLPNGAKPYLDKYNQHVFNNTIKEYRETDEYKQFIKLVENVKTAFDNETKKMVEELCIISQIKGMYMCMGEGADFQMNKANEIKSENGILTLNGHIDGIDFSIRQDTNDPEARLQTSTRFRKKDNAFEIGNHFEDSNFILPSQSEVFNLAVKSVNSDGALQEAETPADYVSKLQDKIMSKMDDMYEDTKYVNHYMHEQVKGEKVMDKSLSLVKNIKKSEIPTPITESNKGLFDFVGLIHFNIQNSTSLEKDRMNSCLEKIQNLVNEYQDTDKAPESGKYPPIIEHYLTDKAILKNTKTLLEGGVVEGESMFDLFNQYRDKSDQRSDGKFGMINTDSLEKDLTANLNSRSLISQHYDAKNESDNAEVVLMDSRNEAEKNSIVGINEVYSLA